jgi:hypothetical protein
MNKFQLPLSLDTAVHTRFNNELIAGCYSLFLAGEQHCFFGVRTDGETFARMPAKVNGSVPIRS